MREEQRKIPAVALRGMTILPGMVAHFDVSREKSVKAVENAMLQDQKIFLVTQREAEQEEPKIEDLYSVGIIAIVKQVIKMQNNIVRVLVEGIERAKIIDFSQYEEYLEAEIEVISEQTEELPVEVQEAMKRGLQETFARYCIANPKPGKELAKQIGEIKELSKLLDYIANNLPGIQ